MRVGSLFSGIGGLDLGLERAGMEIVWQCEIDPYCRRVLEKHWPGVPCYERIEEVVANTTSGQPRKSQARNGGEGLGGRGQEDREIDLICGGFPCQPHSLAGKRLGADDERNLWPAMLSVIENLKPRWVLAENVPGIIGSYLDVVLSDLEGAGYETGALVFPAHALGAPHRRDRVWIIGHEDRKSTDGEVAELSGDVADAGPQREQRLPIGAPPEHPSPGGGGTHGVDPASTRLQNGDSGTIRESRAEQRPKRCDWWATEPNVGRVAHGVPRRVDRLRALGNAVVPQCAEWIGRKIMAVDAPRGGEGR